MTLHLIEEFEKLPADEQRDFSVAILQRTAHFDYEAPSDEELTAAAQAMFSMLDREEEETDASSR